MENIEIIIEKINEGNNNSFKSLYGDDPGILQKQAVRYEGILNKYRSTFQNEEVELFSSPGRTEIGGNHTDHNHGRVLAGAVNLDNIAAASGNNTNTISILSNGYPQFDVDLSDLVPNKMELYSSASIVRGICARMKELGYNIGGFNAIIDGEVPKGSGLSSSASFEVLIGTILSCLFNDSSLDPITIAVIGQYAENNYFGKPCGLMDQTACAVGGFITIDFEDPSMPEVKKVDFDFTSTRFALVITDTGGNHAELNDEYACLPIEMKSVARQLDADVLREVTLKKIIEAIPELRIKTSDRAILRAYHFYAENQRVAKQVKALEQYNFLEFLQMVIDSGYSSFMYNQNIYSVSNAKEQGVSLALALSEMILKGRGAWRVHGGGFAGTIQAFVPQHLLLKYISTLEHVFGEGACKKLFIRDKGSLKLEL